jgi:hypothetical protein
MEAETLLSEISEFCRAVGMAESTFGRRAVNDGKFVGRLKYGGKVTTTTVERVRAFMSAAAPDGSRTPGISREAPPAPRTVAPVAARPPEQNFRFYDNRQKYLMFVNTCSEKWVIADRVAKELDSIRPRPPALRVFDAGMGDGTVLARVMRAMHRRFEKYPFYIVGKEISLEDVRLTLEKMPDRFYEHPATALVLTNLHYAEAPWLTPRDAIGASRMIWKEVALTGSTTAEFESQITALQDFLSENWRASVSPKTGNPVYTRPVALIIYREDCRFLLNQTLPKRGAVQADFDLILASQPYRASASTAFKAKRVIAPLAGALGPGGRLIGIHSHGDDPGLAIIQRVWPGEQPFQTDRYTLLRAVKAELGKSAHNFNLGAGSDAKALFRYDMHTLPGEIDGGAASIGTSTLLAAWNAAIYVAQIEDHRLAEAMATGGYIEATRDTLREFGGLWFYDEAYVISRKRDLV